jgi:hypothetical protein
MEVVVLLGLAALLGLLVLLGTQVNRELRALQERQEALEALVNQVLQEHQVHREILATATADPILRDTPEQATTPVRGTARVGRKEKSK